MRVHSYLKARDVRQLFLDHVTPKFSIVTFLPLITMSYSFGTVIYRYYSYLLLDTLS